MSTRVGWIDEPDHNYAAVVLLDTQSGDSFEIQRAYTFDPHDKKTGMDTYCLVCCGLSHYGGLVDYRVDDNVLEIQLSTPAAEDLGLPEDLTIPIDSAGALLLRRHLPDLLAQQPG